MQTKTFNLNAINRLTAQIIYLKIYYYSRIFIYYNLHTLYL